MIQRWRGQAPTEDAFHDGKSPLPLEIVHELGGVQLSNIDAGEERRLRIALLRGKKVIVFVHGPPYVAITGPKYPRLQSRHGRMCPPGRCGGPLHAILLVDCTSDTYQCLDPYLPASGEQPLELTNDELERCFAGRAAIFTKTGRYDSGE